MNSRKLLLACAVSAAVVTGAPAFAQQSGAELCRATPTDAERIACLERALDIAEAALAAAGPERIATTSPDGAGGEGDSGFRTGVPLADHRDDAATPSARAPATGLGLERLSAAAGSAREDAPVQAEAVSYRERIPGQWQFELSNGEVWRQVSGDGTVLHLFGRDPLGVEIWQSWAGYRMRLLQLDRVIQVERIR